MQSSFALTMIAGAWVGLVFSHGQAFVETGKNDDKALDANDLSLLQQSLQVQEVVFENLTVAKATVCGQWTGKRSVADWVKVGDAGSEEECYQMCVDAQDTNPGKEKCAYQCNGCFVGSSLYKSSGGGCFNRGTAVSGCDACEGDYWLNGESCSPHTDCDALGKVAGTAGSNTADAVCVDFYSTDDYSINKDKKCKSYTTLAQDAGDGATCRQLCVEYALANLDTFGKDSFFCNFKTSDDSKCRIATTEECTGNRENTDNWILWVFNGQ